MCMYIFCICTYICLFGQSHICVYIYIYIYAFGRAGGRAVGGRDPGHRAQSYLHRCIQSPGQYNMSCGKDPIYIYIYSYIYSYVCYTYGIFDYLFIYIYICIYEYLLSLYTLELVHSLHSVGDDNCW